MRKTKVAVFVSGNGTNLQALINAVGKGIIKSGEIALVIADNEEAYAIDRAKCADIKTEIVVKKKCKSQKDFENKIIALLEQNMIDMIVLAGFMSILSGDFTAKYFKRIINIHPSLIPSFCGKGFYGIKVHQAALEYGVKVTGATVHFVNEIPDGGEIIIQKAVNVLKNDTPETLQRRVMEEAEWIILPIACEEICKKIMEEKSE